MQTKEYELIDQAINGDKEALQQLILGIQDMIFNLSLRMLGTIQDAEDASQEIIIKIITRLSSFRKESLFSTWVYRIATNYLINYKNSLFSQRPLSFDYYGKDIENGFLANDNSLLQNVEEDILADELKLSCTNVMLQCLDANSRCIYVLGIIFKLNSKIAAEIFDISADAYRQKLSRIKKQMAEFLKQYCGLSNGMCNCKKRVGYAINSHRLNPNNLKYSQLVQIDEFKINKFIESMENLDSLSYTFSSMSKYSAPQKVKEIVIQIINSNDMQIICSH